MMMRAALVAGLMVLVSAAAMADPGALTLHDEHGARSIDATGSAAVGDLRVPAFLRLGCNRTGRILGWLDFTIAEAEKVTNLFELEPFEGPDAPAQSRPLVSIELLGDPSARPVIAHASGWYSTEHAGGFGFGVGGLNSESRKLSALFKRLAHQGSALRLTIRSAGSSPQHIISEFSIVGSRDVLLKLAEVCR